MPNPEDIIWDQSYRQLGPGGGFAEESEGVEGDAAARDQAGTGPADIAQEEGAANQSTEASSGSIQNEAAPTDHIDSNQTSSDKQEETTIS